MTDFMQLSRNISERIHYDPSLFDVTSYRKKVDIKAEQHYAYIEIGGRKVEFGSGVVRTHEPVHVSLRKTSSLVHRDLDDDIDYLDGDELFEAVKRNITQILQDDPQIDTVVVSTAGSVVNGELVSSYNLRKFITARCIPRLREELPNKRLEVYNDAEALIWGSLYFSQGKAHPHMIDIIVGTGFNILYSCAGQKTITVYNSHIDNSTISEDGDVLEDVIAGAFIERNRHKYFSDFLYYVSAKNVKAAADALVALLGLPIRETQVVFQGGIIEHEPIYTDLFSKNYPHIASAAALSAGQNINAFGAMYHDLFQLELQTHGLTASQ